MTILIYTIICTTDFLDGWVARKYNIVSDFGKVLDPLADKILVLVFLPLVSMKAIAPFPVFLILAREFAIMGLRVFTAKQGLIISANLSGKIKTIITLPICGILMAQIPTTAHAPLPFYLYPLELLRVWIVSWPQLVFTLLIWSMVLITIWSFLDYLFRFMYQRKLKQLESKELTKKYFYSYIPNAISLLNLFCGIYAIILTLNAHNLRLASGFILLGVFLDAIDGKVARFLDVHTQLGEKLDSKADFITFGLAPSVVLFYAISIAFPAYSPLLPGLLSVIFYFSVHYRLKRFNQGGHQDYFDGLPSPGGASVVVMLIGSNFLTSPILLVVAILVMSGLMISKFPYPHNRVSDQKMGFPYLRKPTLAFWFLTIFYYLGVPFPAQFYIPEILLALTMSYVLSPIVPLKKEFR